MPDDYLACPGPPRTDPGCDGIGGALTSAGDRRPQTVNEVLDGRWRHPLWRCLRPSTPGTNHRDVTIKHSVEHRTRSRRSRPERDQTRASADRRRCERLTFGHDADRAPTAAAEHTRHDHSPPSDRHSTELQVGHSSRPSLHSVPA